MTTNRSNVLDMMGRPVPPRAASRRARLWRRLRRVEPCSLLVPMWRWSLVVLSAWAILGLGWSIGWFIVQGAAGPKEVFAMSVAAFLLLSLALHAYKVLAVRRSRVPMVVHEHRHSWADSTPIHHDGRLMRE